MTLWILCLRRYKGKIKCQGLSLYCKKGPAHLCLTAQMTEELDIIRNIEILIGEDNLAAASEMLWKWVYLCGGIEERTEVILLKRRVAEIEREARQNTLSFKKRSRYRTELANSMLASLRAFSLSTVWHRSRAGEVRSYTSQ